MTTCNKKTVTRLSHVMLMRFECLGGTFTSPKENPTPEMCEGSRHDKHSFQWAGDISDGFLNGHVLIHVLLWVPYVGSLSMENSRAGMSNPYRGMTQPAFLFLLKWHVKHIYFSFFVCLRLLCRSVLLFFFLFRECSSFTMSWVRLSSCDHGRTLWVVSQSATAEQQKKTSIYRRFPSALEPKSMVWGQLFDLLQRRLVRTLFLGLPWNERKLKNDFFH